MQNTLVKSGLRKFQILTPNMTSKLGQNRPTFIFGHILQNFMVGDVMLGVKICKFLKPCHINLDVSF